jgi:hypothetical protein
MLFSIKQFKNARSALASAHTHGYHAVLLRNSSKSCNDKSSEAGLSPCLVNCISGIFYAINLAIVTGSWVISLPGNTTYMRLGTANSSPAFP